MHSSGSPAHWRSTCPVRGSVTCRRRKSRSSRRPGPSVTSAGLFASWAPQPDCPNHEVIRPVGAPARSCAPASGLRCTSAPEIGCHTARSGSIFTFQGAQRCSVSTEFDAYCPKSNSSGRLRLKLDIFRLTTRRLECDLRWNIENYHAILPRTAVTTYRINKVPLPILQQISYIQRKTELWTLSLEVVADVKQTKHPFRTV